MTAEVQDRRDQQSVDWAQILDAALTLPGHVSASYSRFYNYSYGNIALLWAQGVEPQPVATYKRWQEIGRQVIRGAKAKEIIRPITIKLQGELDEYGNPKTITRFKPVRCIFPLSDTQGPDLPPIETPSWSLQQAMTNLEITEEPYRMFDGNAQGYSYNRSLAINPVAADPFMTYTHEIAHIELGHTTGDPRREYATHRGEMEFQAESTSYLVGNELGELTPERASESRGYIAHWLQGERPADKSIREVFKATTSILSAGRLAVAGAAPAEP